MLCDELPKLVAMWPHDIGQIERVLFSPPDWDDRPQVVEAAGRWIRSSSLPHDDTRLMTVMLSDHSRRHIDVIPPGASRDFARHTFNDVTGIYRALKTKVAASTDPVDWGDERGYA